VIAAAGNSSNTVKQYPAAYDAVIGVSSLDPDCVKKSSFSSYGTANVELAAPGANIYSTLPDHKTFWNSLGLFPYDYGYLEGTSMACPHVVGAAAAYRAYRPDISAQTTRGALRKFADNLGNQEYFGYGRVDMDPYTD
jgi:thermitase